MIGHEFGGRVSALGAGTGGGAGSGVPALAVGDRVVVDPVLACGACHACRAGRPNVCANLQVIGVHRDGGFRSVLNVPAANVIRVPDGVPGAVAALAEPFAVAANVLSRTGCAASDVVLVYGAGTVGLTVLQVARMQGARMIVADREPARLARAAALGAHRTIDSSRDDVPAAMRSENDGCGPTVVIDGAGVPALLEEAVAIASPAGRIGLLGFSATPSALVQQRVVAKELSLFGSRLNNRFMPQVLQWFADGALDAQALITQTYAAADARQAFALIEQEPFKTIKVQLVF